jgi:Mor family transcriptional regulator
MKYTQTFEMAWRRFVNTPIDRDRLVQQEELLCECIKVATTISELTEVFHAATEILGIERVRPPALKKMIQLVKTKEDAGRVYVLASKRGPKGYVFPVCHLQAKKKLESFTEA